MNQPIRSVLFDLDGTLLDTAPDLANALNAVLQESGKPALAFDTIRPHVSHGASALITLGFEKSNTDPMFESYRLRLLEFYQQNLCQQTTFFDDMERVLASIEARGLSWGIVTNKPARFTEPLLENLGLLRRASCIVSGDTLPRKKPHPDPLLHAARILGIAPEQAVYVGDARRDIEAAQAAGMRSLVALFGYLDADDEPQDWGADAYISTPSELLSWLDQNGQSTLETI